jgi:hypothetical protein
VVGAASAFAFTACARPRPLPIADVGRAPAPVAVLAAEPQTPCAEALSWVAAAGLSLPAGAGYHCPSTEFPHQGAACWHAAACPGGRFIAVNMELMGPVSPAYLHHVVAHEVCHILQFDASGNSTEAEADACAAAHGAPG